MDLQHSSLLFFARAAVLFGLVIATTACGGDDDGGMATDDDDGGAGDGCSSSVLVGVWGVTTLPNTPPVEALRFATDCVVAEGTSGTCPGKLTHSSVTSTSGTTTLTCEPTGDTQTCAYSITGDNPRMLSFGCDGSSGDFVEIL